MLIGYELLRKDDLLDAEQSNTEAVKRLEQAGCSQIYLDFDRENRLQFQEAFESLKTGDILVLIRLDSLGSSRLSFLHQLTLLKEKGVHLQSLNENFLIPSNSLPTEVLIKKLLSLSQLNKCSSTLEKKRKSKKGRPTALPPEKRELVRLLKKTNQKISITEICKLAGISRPTYNKYFPKPKI